MDQVNHDVGTHVLTVSVVLLLCACWGAAARGAEGDSPLEAYFLSYGTEVSGTIGSDFAPDYYKVLVPARGRLVVRLYDISLNDAKEELHLSLFRTTQNSVGVGYTTYSNVVAEAANDYTTPDVIDIPDLSRGIYFVKVLPVRSNTWSGADYKIEASFTVFPPVVFDDVGDRKQYALPIVNQLPTNCTLSDSDDADYFECHVPYNTDLTLSLTDISAGGNVDLEVYTAWDVLIGSASRVGSADELLFLADLVPGQYFIRVFGEGPAQYTFTATCEFAQASDILDDVGGDLAHAMPLLPGNPSVFCLQPYNIDSDYFCVYQPEDGPFTVDVYDLFVWDGNEDFYVRVLDEYGMIIAQSDNGRPTPEHIEVNLSRGQYFVAVYGERQNAFNGGIYTINVETAGSDIGDAFNQAAQIHAIPYGSETYGYPYLGMIDAPGDTDFFQVVLKDRGFVYLTIDRMLYANVDVQLFDAYHNLLQTSANLDTQAEEIYVDGLNAGVYFIKVYSRDDEIGQYRLTPTIGTPTSPISDDIGDGTSDAFPLVPFRRVGGYVWDDNTSDCFAFALSSPNETVRVRVSDQHVWDGNEDIRVHVYDASEVQIGYSDNDYEEDELVELIGLDAGIYYVKVTPERRNTMSPVQYNIVVETDAAPLPSAQVSLPADILGTAGEILYAPVVLDNPGPDRISHVTLGVQFDPTILEPMGVTSAGLTRDQWNAQVRYTRSANSMSVSMDNFATMGSGGLLELVFQIAPGASVGSTSALTVLAAGLNGALVPAADGRVTVVQSSD
ncbi:MAG: hypothetical protein JSW27_03345 [Phycisphaerales bacterium]|nr:MAG: hypothetical protein JSW27_03345 [Phycisphaerales bacterium]